MSGDLEAVELVPVGAQPLRFVLPYLDLRQRVLDLERGLVDVHKQIRCIDLDVIGLHKTGVTG